MAQHDNSCFSENECPQMNGCLDKWQLAKSMMAAEDDANHFFVLVRGHSLQTVH